LYILLADETNRQPSADIQFFVYGALFFPAPALKQLDEGIDQIRRSAGYTPSDELKFDTRSRPSQVSVEDCTAAKSAVLDLCKSAGCRFIAHVILHDIIKNQAIEQQCYWAADYVFGRFNTFLHDEANDYGICIVDNLPTRTQFQYFAEKFNTGLRLPSGKCVRLSSIKMFGASCIGACHANSAMDIALGAFRYCINNPRNPDAARTMMGKVMDLLWHERQGDKILCLDKGLSIRPKLNKIVVAEYKKKYKKLFEHINSMIKDY